MAWIRCLPSGLWAATVYTPAGRITQTHELVGVITDWAKDLESDIRRGDFMDPRLAKTTVGEVWDKYASTRRLEKASRARDESHWRCHVAPRWARTAVGAILKPDVTAWIQAMEKAHADDCTNRKCEGCRHGGWTIIASLNVLKAVLELAVDAGMIRSNPARRVKAPVPPQHIDRVITADEERTILDRLAELFPARRDAGLFVETLFETGGRWEEIAAVRRDAVNLRNGLIALGPVMERDGTIREYPKGARNRQHPGFRDAPVGPALLTKLRAAVLATSTGGLIFPAPMGGSLLYPTWLRRVWDKALRVPVEGGWTPLVEEPLPTPHDCRHTFGTRLADAGMEQHDRMALMGHKDLRSGQRYTHSGASRFDSQVR